MKWKDVKVGEVVLYRLLSCTYSVVKVSNELYGNAYVESLPEYRDLGLLNFDGMDEMEDWFEEGTIMRTVEDMRIGETACFSKHTLIYKETATTYVLYDALHEDPNVHGYSHLLGQQGIPALEDWFEAGECAALVTNGATCTCDFYEVLLRYGCKCGGK